MKAKIKTETLKDLMAKAVKGAGNNKLIPITNLMELKMYEKTLQITTTDMVNFLYVKGELEEPVNKLFNIVIEAEKFAKLISKMTSQYTEISVLTNCVQVKGNGNYTIDIPLDDEPPTADGEKPVDKYFSYLDKEDFVDLVLWVDQVLSKEYEGKTEDKD